MTFGKIGATPTIWNHPTAISYRGIIVNTWDGIENDGYGVHNASATAWKDLVGGYDAAKSGSPSFSANAGMTDGQFNTFIATLPNSSRFIQAAKSSPVTIEMCLTAPSVFASRAPFAIEDSNGNTSTYRMVQIFMRNSNVYSAAPYDNGGTGFVGEMPAQSSLSGTFACVLWYESGKAYVRPYFNGVQGTVGSSAQGKFDPSNIDSFGVSNWYVRIGRTHNNSYTAPYHRITLHAGEVSANDLAYNANVDKLRFGL